MIFIHVPVYELLHTGTRCAQFGDYLGQSLSEPPEDAASVHVAGEPMYLHDGAENWPALAH